MTVDDARVRIKAAGFEITEEKRLPNDFGIQLKVNGPGFNGVSVSIYDKGTYLVQGNNKGKVETALSQTLTSDSTHSDSSTAPSITLAHAEPAVALPDSGNYESDKRGFSLFMGMTTRLGRSCTWYCFNSALSHSSSPIPAEAV